MEKKNNSGQYGKTVFSALKNKIVRRVVPVFMSAAMVVQLVPLNSYAETYKISKAITGEYTCVPMISDQQYATYSMVYSDDCFAQPSYSVCGHLGMLSMQAAEASAIYCNYIDGVADRVDTSEGNKSIIGFLTSAGFSEAETNKYYVSYRADNSVGVAVGHREINVGGKKYTVLAVILCGGFYNIEFAGNMDVGCDTIHKGFKEARDEALRFVKQYVSAHDITGDVKVWTAGHSRGAAVANLIGGFFAAGGDGYLGDVSVKPEDVYCYTFGTPSTVLGTVNRSELLSVGGARGGIYENDTPGEAFIVSSDETVDPTDSVFSGIHNFAYPQDPVTYLPLKQWGYTYLGKVEDDESFGGKITVDDMIAVLKERSPFIYGIHEKYGDYRSFERKTFDIPSLSVVKDEGADKNEDVGDYLNDRMNQLLHVAPDPEAYSAGIDEALMAVFGILGITDIFYGLDVNVVKDDFVLPAVVSVLGVLSDKIREEKRAENDDEAIALVLEEAISFVSGKTIEHGTLTADDILILLSEYVSEHENSEAIRQLRGIIDTNDETIGSLLGLFFAPYVADENASTSDKVLAFVKALSQGPAEGTSAAENGYTAATSRSIIYFVLPLLAPELGEVITDGSCKLVDIVHAVLSMLLTVKDSDGNVIKSYSTLEEAAGEMLTPVLEKLLTPSMEYVRKKGTDNYDRARAYVDVVEKNIFTLLKAVCRVVLFDDGPFDIGNSVSNLTTLISNFFIVAEGHLPGTYSAWQKALLNSHAAEHTAYAKTAFKAPVYTWNEDHTVCTATAAAEDDETYVVTQESEALVKVITEAACTVKEVTSYTAMFTDPLFEAQSLIVTAEKPLGHKFVNGVCERCNQPDVGSVKLEEIIAGLTGESVTISLDSDAVISKLKFPKTLKKLTINGNGHTIAFDSSAAIKPEHELVLSDVTIKAEKNSKPQSVKVTAAEKLTLDKVIFDCKDVTLNASNAELLVNDLTADKLALKGNARSKLTVSGNVTANSVTGFDKTEVQGTLAVEKTLTVNDLKLAENAVLKNEKGALVTVKKTLEGSGTIHFADGAKPVVLKGAVSGKIKITSDSSLENMPVFNTKVTGLDEKFDVSGAVVTPEDGAYTFGFYTKSGKVYLRAKKFSYNDKTYFDFSEIVDEINKKKDKESYCNITLLGDVDIGGALKFPTKGRYAGISLDGAGHTLTFKGTSVALTGDTVLKNITVKSQNGKKTVDWKIKTNGFSLEKESAELVGCTVK